MKTYRAKNARSAAEVALAGAILDAMDQPALLIHESDATLAANGPWCRVFAHAAETTSPPTVADWLAHCEGADILLDRLRRARAADDDPAVVGIATESNGATTRFAARITRLLTENDDRRHTLILLEQLYDRATDDEHAGQPPVQMHRLLVRQTLIEERERRRLGRAVHDHVTQLLVQIRRRLADDRDANTPWNPDHTVADIDRLIRILQELTSSISPPVLEDLGLLPAMRWLAESIASTYGASARCEDDGTEPRLSSEVRTIAFRAIRELVVNATKHAPGAQITLSSTVDAQECRITVSDNGPGFGLPPRPPSPDTYTGYGLLSVEQQIRAVGGAFEIRSTPGKGTRATITLPLSPEVDDADSDRNA